jgi:uncharacterized protein
MATHKPDLCIYHAPCQDGFTAAWAIWRRWPDIEFHPGVYGQEPPDVTGKHVLIVDFSYKLPVLQRLGAVAASITILDHHKSAELDLAPFKVPVLRHPPALAYVDEGMNGVAGPYPIQALFDMDRSGAVMAWHYVHAGKLPALVLHVQDRDLWRFEFEHTREIAANLFSLDYTFENWNDAAGRLEEDTFAFISEGEAIERKHHKDVAELLDQTARFMIIGGHRVPVANLPYTMASDAANTLAEGNPFGACYFDRADGSRVFSLRSKAEGLDVSLIATRYGGGGHARAAGFQAPANWEGDDRGL